VSTGTAFASAEFQPYTDSSQVVAVCGSPLRQVAQHGDEGRVDRPLCPYRQEARFIGSTTIVNGMLVATNPADLANASNYRCITPPPRICSEPRTAVYLEKNFALGALSIAYLGLNHVGLSPTYFQTDRVATGLVARLTVGKGFKPPPLMRLTQGRHQPLQSQRGCASRGVCSGILGHEHRCRPWHVAVDPVALS